jgi:general secretion pathway protein F
MVEFVYKATDLAGKIFEGSMEGRDEKMVVESLQKLGYLPIRITAIQTKTGLFKLPLSAYLERITTNDLLIFTQELSTLLEAGLPLDRSLQILTELAEKERFREVIRDILKKIEAGRSFSEALSSYPSIFPKLYVNMTKAGEAGGILNVILSRLSKYLLTTKEMKDYLISVLIYPAILTLASGASIIILLTFVIPRFAKIFADMGQTIPLPTQIMLSISQGVRSYWWVLGGAILLGWYGFRAYIKSGEGKVSWDGFKLKLVIIGNLVRQMEVARFSRTLGTLLQSGVPILQAIQIVRETVTNEIIARSVSEVHTGVKQGGGISKTLQTLKVFPPLAIHMITVGEETGKLDEMLIKVAENYEVSLQNALKRFINLLEPMIILIMGAVVGFIVVSMLLAIFSINEMPF